MKMNYNSESEPTAESVREFKQFCFIRGLDPKRGESLKHFEDYTKINKLTKASIFGDTAKIKSNATNQLKNIINVKNK